MEFKFIPIMSMTIPPQARKIKTKLF